MDIPVKNISIPLHEVELHPLQSQGAGGQNVNKVATAIHLRFDIVNSSLPEPVKMRLLQCGDHRISHEGILVIKAQAYRTQERNRADALKRLHEIIASVWQKPAKRKPTKPSKAARAKRVDRKIKRGQQKSMRKKVDTT